MSQQTEHAVLAPQQTDTLETTPPRPPVQYDDDFDSEKVFSQPTADARGGANYISGGEANFVMLVYVQYVKQTSLDVRE